MSLESEVFLAKGPRESRQLMKLMKYELEKNGFSTGIFISTTDLC